MVKDHKLRISSIYLDILILLILPLFFLFLHAFSKRFSLMFDDNLLTFANYYNVVRFIAEGSLPLRDPYLYVDLIRVGVSSILYLPRAVSHLVGAAFFTGDVEHLRIFWLGLHFLYICLPSICMYLLLRYLKFLRSSSIFGAIVYGWNLYMTIMSGVYTAHQRSLHYAVIPLIWLIGIYSLDSKKYYLNILSGLLIGWAILAGGLQPVIYIVPFLLLYLFFQLLFKDGLSKESILRSFWIPFLMIISMILCILPLFLTTPEILPFLKRAHKVAGNIQSSVPPGVFYFGLIEPFFQWSKGIKFPWESCSYLGFISIPLFLTGLLVSLKKIFEKNSLLKRWFLAIFLFSITICIGYSYFPPWLLKVFLFQKGLTRYPFRLYPLVIFAVSYFVACGLDYICINYMKGRRPRRFLLLGAILLVGVFSFGLKIFHHTPVFGGNIFFLISGAIICLSLLVFILVWFKPRFIWLLIPLIICDLGLTGYVYCANRFDVYKISSIRRDLYQTSFLRIQDEGWISQLPKREIPYRVFIFTFRESEITTQTGYIYHRLRHPFGYSGSLGINHFEKFREIRDLDHPIFDILGVSFFCVYKNSYQHTGKIHFNEDALPLIYTAGGIKLFETDSEILEELYRGNNEATSTVYFSRESIGKDASLLEGLFGPYRDREPVVRFDNITYKSSKIHFDIMSSEDVLLVLSEPWLPPWQASIDGRNTKIYQAYGLIQSIIVPKGSHSVSFEYTFPRYLIYISLIAQIGIIFGVMAYYLMVRNFKIRYHCPQDVPFGD